MKWFVVLTILFSLLCGANPLDLSAQGSVHKSDGFHIGAAGYTFRKFSIDQTLESLRRLGIKYLSIKDFWLPLDATVEDMAAFRDKCASYDVLDLVVRKVRETGIKMAIHTHGPDLPDLFPDIRVVVEKVGDPTLGIGCCMDLAHSYRYGQDPARDIRKYAKWIWDIHIKDVTLPSKAGVAKEMGRGGMDIPAIVKSLRRIGYKGVISIEYEADEDDPLPAVAETAGYLRGVMDGIK